MSRTVRALLLAVAFVLVTATPAFAHNSLKSSTPAKGTTLDAAPPAVSLTFAEALDPTTTTVTITAPDGTGAAGKPELADKTATVAFTPTVAGEYKVAYSVRSHDGYVSNESFTFTLSAAAVPAATKVTTTTAAPTTEPSTTAATTTAAAETHSDTHPAAAETDTGSTPWWPWALGGLVVLFVGGGIVALRRRKA
ncbi:MAG TPA: copper resistance CopC family protein [Actinokineospora sp.]|nr:copper resistance CopC family protein [Actinokineospora sp.]